MVGAIKRGLTLKDFEVMTIGMIMDYIITYNNIHHQDDEEEAIREATQADFDAF